MKSLLVLLRICLGLFAAAPAAASAAPITVRTVGVPASEIGADTGGFRAWAREMPQLPPFDAAMR